eukprot:4072189-Prymnesium_polylepis.1
MAAAGTFRGRTQRGLTMTNECRTKSDRWLAADEEREVRQYPSRVLTFMMPFRHSTENVVADVDCCSLSRSCTFRFAL